ncbi:6996_t:CDS:2, partial [Gigaspora margarita]
QEANLGYEMQDNVLDTNKRNEGEKVHVGVLAYADDMTWVIYNQKSIQETINISNEFYELNEIKLNPTKTELKEATRFLGVWISARNQQRSDMRKAKAE